MKIALINGSPKIRDSASGAILKLLGTYLKDAETVTFQWNRNAVPNEELEQIASCDAAVIAFPLYVDCLPSHLLRCMKQLEEYLNQSEEKNLSRFGVIVNNGFFDAHQNIPAAEVIRSWCGHADISFIGGLGIAGGGMLGLLEQYGGNGPFKIISEKLQSFAEKILDENCAGNFDLTHPAFPAFLYKQAAQMGWRMEAKKNGLKVKDLRRQ